MKIYNVEGKIKDWVKTHSAEIYGDILIAAEVAAEKEENSFIVCSIRTVAGVTDYVLKDPFEVVRALRKVEKYYVSTEEYENAARARDCGLLWEVRAMIYRKNT